MAEKIRWGILGTGSIAKKFAEGLKAVPDAALAAVGSRKQETADAFGAQFGIARRHASYEALAADREVDAVYVATPHSFHMENTVLCLDAGKATLCEKPFAINAAQAKEMVRVARQKKVFLMEAMWTRFLPIMVKTRELIAAGAIGEARMVYASFGFRAGFKPEGRLFNPALGGGGLLDVGIYPVSFASMVFRRQPQAITGLAEIGETGVDEQAGIVFRYENGGMALLSCAVRTTTVQEARIMGTDGQILIEAPFWRGTKVRILSKGRDETFDLPYAGNGYNCEAVEVGACLRAGKLESDTMPLDESVAIMRTLDAIRAQWGVVYPME